MHVSLATSLALNGCFFNGTLRWLFPDKGATHEGSVGLAIKRAEDASTALQIVSCAQRSV